MSHSFESPELCLSVFPHVTALAILHIWAGLFPMLERSWSPSARLQCSPLAVVRFFRHDTSSSMADFWEPRWQMGLGPPKSFTLAPLYRRAPHTRCLDPGLGDGLRTKWCHPGTGIPCAPDLLFMCPVFAQPCEPNPFAPRRPSGGLIAACFPTHHPSDYQEHS